MTELCLVKVKAVKWEIDFASDRLLTFYGPNFDSCQANDKPNSTKWAVKRQNCKKFLTWSFKMSFQALQEPFCWHSHNF